MPENAPSAGASAWTADQPLRPDATDEQILCRGLYLRRQDEWERIPLAQTAREFAAACVAASRSSGATADSERLDYLEAWLDSMCYIHRKNGDPLVHIDWFAGDGGGHWFTEAETWRDAIKAFGYLLCGFGHHANAFYTRTGWYPLFPIVCDRCGRLFYVTTRRPAKDDSR